MSGRTVAISIALVFAGVLVLALHPISSADVWWQLATGERVLASGPPSTDPYSYAFRDRPWIEPRWLYCTAAALVVRAAGLNGLILAKLAALFATFAVLASIGRRRAAWALPLGLAAALALMLERFGVRPELVSFLGLALTMRLLEGWRRGERARRLTALPLLQLVWNNAHTLWVLGPAVQWLWLAGEWLGRRIRRQGTPSNAAAVPSLRAPLIAAVLSTLFAPLNPWGLDGALFPWRLLSQIRGGHELDALIAEFHGPFSPMFLAADHRTVALVVVAALGVAGFVIARRRTAWGRLAVFSAFAALACLAVRNVALFGVIAGATLIANLADADDPVGTVPEPLRRAALVLPTIWLTLLIPLVVTDVFYRFEDRVERFGMGVTDRRFPIRALELVRRERLPRPLLHALGDGGYLLYEGGPRSVYIDGRLEVYDGSIVAAAVKMMQTGEGLEREAYRLGVQTILVRNRFGERGALATLERSPRWRAVYYDHLHVIYLRVAPQTREAIERLAIDWRDPDPPPGIARPVSQAPRDPLAGLWPRAGDGFKDERLGSLLLGMGNDPAARRHLERAFELEPGRERVRLLLGLLVQAGGDDRRAAELLAGVPRTMRRRADVRWLEGEVALRAGRALLALQAFGEARVSAPDEAVYLQRYISAALAANRSSEAEAALREWLELQPRDVSGMNTLAQLLLRRGRRDEAAGYLRRSLEIEPGQPAIRALLGGESPGGS